MSKTGRPKLGTAAKGGVIRFRVSVTENDVLQGAASRKGRSLSAWAREVLLAEAGKAN